MKTEDYKRLTYNENDGLKEETIRRLTFDGSEDWKQNKLSEEEIIEECNKLFVTMVNVHIDGKAMADLLDLYKQEKEKNEILDKEAQGYLEELVGDKTAISILYQKEKEKNKEARDYILDILNEDFPNVGTDDIKNIYSILEE